MFLSGGRGQSTRNRPSLQSANSSWGSQLFQRFFFIFTVWIARQHTAAYSSISIIEHFRIERCAASLHPHPSHHNINMYNRITTGNGNEYHNSVRQTWSDQGFSSHSPPMPHSTGVQGCHSAEARPSMRPPSGSVAASPGRRRGSPTSTSFFGDAVAGCSTSIHLYGQQVLDSDNSF